MSTGIVENNAENNGEATSCGAPRAATTRPKATSDVLEAVASVVLPTDSVFDFTSELATSRRASLWKLVKTALVRRKELRPAWSRIRALPRLTVPSRDDVASRDLTHLLRKRIGPFRHRTHAVAVLEIPHEAGAYRKGRSRRSLRYNSGKAIADGTKCISLLGQDEILRRFGQVVADGWGIERGSRKYRRWTGNVQDVPHGLYFAAVAEDDSALVFSKVIIAGAYARLHTFIQNDKYCASSAARFLLAEHMVESLRGAGVKYLIVDTVLGLPQGIRYYQQLAGYVTYNVTVAPA